MRTLATRSHEHGGFVGQRLTMEERYFGTGAAPSHVFEDKSEAVFGVIPRNQRDNWLVGEQVETILLSDYRMSQSGTC